MIGRSDQVTSWGNIARGRHVLVPQRSRFDAFPHPDGVGSVLPFGQGRSYGDSCLNIGGGLVLTRGLNRFTRFDRATGVLACEAGVLLSEILELVVPAGWFLRVVPGTQHVTVGGAIANDVHGKNHHAAGTFGCHVVELELLRSTGERLRCSRNRNAEWFAATSGGLGLTGLIVSAELQLRPVAGPCMEVETMRFGNLDEFFAIAAESDERFEYTVAWIDCLAAGTSLGRGIFQRANHSSLPASASIKRPGQLAMPFRPPVSLVNPLSLRLFNTVHFHSSPATVRRSLQHYETFFFPLDRIRNWNRLYGPRGFHQYQCVIPMRESRAATAELLKAISAADAGSFLAVLKHCGACPAPGLLSFPLHGATLALDFPHQPTRTASLFETLDAIVLEAGGRLYPAKDGRMPSRVFQAGYPEWRRHTQLMDPYCGSTFWRRVTSEAA